MREERWLVLTLEAPLLAFGGVAVDHIGVTRDFPALSMLTGLIANALGYRRTDWERHRDLQKRLIFAACREQEIRVLTDVQNVGLKENDKGWTTWGEPEGRAGASYGAPHRRYRDYHMDAKVTVVLRLDPDNATPNLDAVADAMDRPKRPLFIGRKPCLPAAPLRQDRSFVTAPTAYTALGKIAADTGAPLRAIWPYEEGSDTGDRIADLPDLRNWRTGLHGGTRQIVEGTVLPKRAS